MNILLMIVILICSLETILSAMLISNSRTSRTAESKSLKNRAFVTGLLSHVLWPGNAALMPPMPHAVRNRTR